ncbi:MAG: radical SAM protein [Candidatus Aenigmatarchaeota archaeon]
MLKERKKIDFEISKYSIYYPHRTKFPDLEFLIGDDTKGWRAERNLFKSLNHLEILKKKEKIAEKLGINNIKSEPELFEKNYSILESHYKKIITTDAAIEKIADNVGLSKNDVEFMLNEHFPIGHMEFHPSDICNLNCQGCTYGHGVKGLGPKKIVFPFEHLDKLKALKPKSILFSGGGEPTLYKYKNYNFGDVVEKIHEIMPKTLLALITNGTFVPKGNWVSHLKWVRISIDAATPETYMVFRGKNLFEKVTRNLLKYLNTSIPKVGGTFLYSKININEYVDFARYFYKKVKEEQPNNLCRLNLSYRPLRRNPNDKRKKFPGYITKEDIEKTVKKIIEFANESIEVENFLREQTNIEAVTGGNLQPPMPFKRCYYSQIFHIVRANGDIRPCFVSVLEPDFVLGNIIKDSISSISLNVLFIATLSKKICNPEECKQSHCNYILEQGLLDKFKPLKIPSVAEDPFF